MKNGMRRILPLMLAMVSNWSPWKEVKDRPIRNNYPDPILRDPFLGFTGGRYYQKTNRGKPRLGRPPCDPGTITYRDWLVRHLGYDRRRADGWLYAWKNYGTELPMP